MDNKLSLKAQLQAMNTGDVMITDHQRTGVYVAAKRAGLKVSTKDLPDGQIEVTALAKIGNTPKAKISEYDATLERVKGWTIETRKRLFDAFLFAPTSMYYTLRRLESQHKITTTESDDGIRYYALKEKA